MSVFGDGIEIVQDRLLRYDQWEISPLDGKIHAGSLEFFGSVLDKWNERYAIVNTVPPCILNKLTGQLEEFPEYRVPIWTLIKPRWQINRNVA